MGQNKSPVVGKLSQDHQLSCLMTFDEEAADADFSLELIRERCCVKTNRFEGFFKCRFWPHFLVEQIYQHIKNRQAE